RAARAGTGSDDEHSDEDRSHTPASLRSGVSDLPRGESSTVEKPGEDLARTSVGWTLGDVRVPHDGERDVFAEPTEEIGVPDLVRGGLHSESGTGCRVRVASDHVGESRFE